VKIRVINPVAAAVGGSNEAEIARLTAAASQQTEISFRYIADGPLSIESDYEDALAVPDTVRAAIEAEQEGMDAVLINCTADTGLAACRECVAIPVVAPSMAAMHLAAQLVHRFSVLTFLDRTIPRFEDMAHRWGLGHKLASVRSVEIPVLSISDDETTLAHDLFDVGQRCVLEDGAHALVLGCTAFELVSAQTRGLFMQANTPVVLLEPYLVALRQAEALVLMGIGHGKLSYPYPKDRIRT
jgi:allantoin racemase